MGKLSLVFALIFFVASSCGDKPFQPVSVTEEEIKKSLENRSFRQFDPAKDANTRKAVVLDFFYGISLWAQYAEGGWAKSEWEIVAENYRIEKSSDNSEFQIYFIEPVSTQTFPTACENCIQTQGVSISIRNIFDDGKISFKLNDPHGNLPSPFPVFKSWTSFNEDELFE